MPLLRPARAGKALASVGARTSLKHICIRTENTPKNTILRRLKSFTLRHADVNPSFGDGLTWRGHRLVGPCGIEAPFGPWTVIKYVRCDDMW